ncbi:unnamed protein product [Trichobilharzia regenti]|nr:unnamed protein product [Trichobilharzia regenti]
MTNDRLVTSGLGTSESTSSGVVCRCGEPAKL